MHVRVLLARYRAYLMCPECLGTRLKSDALHYRIQGKDISQINAMSVGEAHAFFQALKPAGALDQVASLILDEIRRRLGYLVGVGLEYLTLDRQSRTLPAPAQGADPRGGAPRGGWPRHPRYGAR